MSRRSWSAPTNRRVSRMSQATRAGRSSWNGASIYREPISKGRGHRFFASRADNLQTALWFLLFLSMYITHELDSRKHSQLCKHVRISLMRRMSMLSLIFCYSSSVVPELQSASSLSKDSVSITRAFRLRSLYMTGATGIQIRSSISPMDPRTNPLISGRITTYIQVNGKIN